jgi:hypothetical protein
MVEAAAAINLILLANLIWVLTDDRMARLGLKPQANSSNPLKRVKCLDGRCFGRSIVMSQVSPTCFSWF